MVGQYIQEMYEISGKYGFDIENLYDIIKNK